MNAQSVMQLENVSFGYRPDRPVVRNITAAVWPGQVHALIGPNAAGKSTLLNLMLGHRQPDVGEITVADRPVHRLASTDRAAWISYVPQRAGSAFAYSVRQVIAMARLALPRDPDAIDRAVAACEVADLLDRPFDELSIGQQQRVLMARAMAQAAGQGRLMLLDEPTSAMDLAHIHRTMNQLRSVAADGLAVVVVLHDVNLAARYADRIWLMHEGRLAANGRWPEVMQPDVLSPVYGVELEMTESGKDGRPRFEAQLPGETVGQ